MSLCHSKTGSSKKRLKCLQQQVSKPQSFQIFSTFATVDPTRPNTTHDIMMLSCLMAQDVKSVTTKCDHLLDRTYAECRHNPRRCWLWGSWIRTHTHTHTHTTQPTDKSATAQPVMWRTDRYRIASRSGSRPAYIDICPDDTRHCHQHTRPAHYRPGSAAPDSLKQCRTHNKCTQWLVEGPHGRRSSTCRVHTRRYSQHTRYDTRCYFNVRSKADISQLNLPHGTDN